MPPDNSREDIMFCLCPFSDTCSPLISQTAQQRPVKVCWRFGPTRAGKIHSDISPNPPLSFTGGGSKSAKFCLDFRHQSYLTSPSFGTKQYIGNLK